MLEDSEETIGSEEQGDVQKKDDLDSQMIRSVFGLITVGQFKDFYADVFTSVAEREHFATGYVLFKKHFEGLGQVGVRTLRKQERQFIQVHAPIDYYTLGDGEDSLAKFKEDRESYQRYIKESNEVFIRFNDLTLLFGLYSFQDRILDIPLSALTAANSYADFMKTPAVKAKMEQLSILPEGIVTRLHRIISDVATASERALVSVLKNQLKPVSG